jgi:hypothetical protein
METSEPKPSKQLAAVLKLIERLNEMRSEGCSEEEMDKLSDEISSLQMNLIVGSLFDD